MRFTYRRFRVPYQIATDNSANAPVTAPQVHVPAKANHSGTESVIVFPLPLGLISRLKMPCRHRPGEEDAPLQAYKASPDGRPTTSS